MLACHRRSIGPRRTRAHRPSLLDAASRFAPEALESRVLLAAVAWDGGGGDGDFLNPLNWDADVLPTADDDVTISPGVGPGVELHAGGSIDIKSLVLNWPLTVSGELGVIDQAQFGDWTLFIASTGVLRTGGLELAASGTSVTNAGRWTIGGTSLIERRINSTGTIEFEADAVVTLGDGTGAPGALGAIESTSGVVTIGDRAVVAAAGGRIRYVGVLNLGAGAQLDRIDLFADGGSVTANVRLNADPAEAATITNSVVRLEWAFVNGAVAFEDSQVVMVGRAIFYGESTVLGGTIVAPKVLLVRPPIAAPSQANSLFIQDAMIQARDRFFGNATVAGGHIQAGAASAFGAGPAIGNGVVLRDATMSGKWAVAGTLTASGLGSSGSTLTLHRDATLVLEGVGTNDLGGLAMLRRGAAILWTDGDVSLAAEDPGRRTRLSVPHSTSFHASFSGPGSHVLNIVGGREFSVSAIAFRVSFAGPGCELVVNGRFMNGNFHNREGEIEVSNGTLRFGPDLVNILDGRLQRSGWLVGPGGSLEFGTPLHASSATITIIGDGTVPSLADLELNIGTIILDGSGGWLTGSTEPTHLRNYGQIIKTGEGERVVPVSITQLTHGSLHVESGRLTLDAPRFVNRGTVTLGSDEFMSPRAVLRVTGLYHESDRSIFEVRGQADGDVDDLPRFGVGGTMRLAGEVRILLSTLNPLTTPLSWQFGYAAHGRTGQYAMSSITLAGVTTDLNYTSQRILVTFAP